MAAAGQQITKVRLVAYTYENGKVYFLIGKSGRYINFEKTEAAILQPIFTNYLERIGKSTGNFERDMKTVFNIKGEFELNSLYRKEHYDNPTEQAIIEKNQLLQEIKHALNQDPRFQIKETHDRKEIRINNKEEFRRKNFIGGNIESGETERQALLREINEEINLDGAPLGLDLLNRLITVRISINNTSYHVVKINRRNLVNLVDNSEIFEIDWFNKDEIRLDNIVVSDVQKFFDERLNRGVDEWYQYRQASARAEARAAEEAAARAAEEARAQATAARAASQAAARAKLSREEIEGGWDVAWSNTQNRPYYHNPKIGSFYDITEARVASARAAEAAARAAEEAAARAAEEAAARAAEEAAARAAEDADVVLPGVVGAPMAPGEAAAADAAAAGQVVPGETSRKAPRTESFNSPSSSEASKIAQLAAAAPAAATGAAAALVPGELVGRVKRQRPPALEEKYYADKARKYKMKYLALKKELGL